MTIRGIGIIGTGRHGSRYAQHLRADFPLRARLHAISRLTQSAGEEQARAWGCTYYQDWHRLIADPAIDAVISVTTPNLNPQIAAACVRHRKPLLIEKPLAVDLAAAHTMVADFRQADLPLTVGQTLRYNQTVQALRQSLPSIGRVYAFCATHHLEPSTLPWLTDPQRAGGGVIFHTAVHLFDTLRFITGHEVVRIRVSAFQVHNPRLEDLVSAQLEMTDGIVGVAIAGKVGASRAGRYEFTGAEGQLQGDQIHGELEIIRGMTVTPVPHAPSAPTIRPLLGDWLAFLDGEGKNPIPGEEGLAAVKICEAARRSARLGEWVTVASLP